MPKLSNEDVPARVGACSTTSRCGLLLVPRGVTCAVQTVIVRCAQCPGTSGGFGLAAVSCRVSRSAGSAQLQGARDPCSFPAPPTTLLVGLRRRGVPPGVLSFLPPLFGATGTDNALPLPVSGGAAQHADGGRGGVERCAPRGDGGGFLLCWWGCALVGSASSTGRLRCGRCCTPWAGRRVPTEIGRAEESGGNLRPCVSHRTPTARRCRLLLPHRDSTER